MPSQSPQRKNNRINLDINVLKLLRGFNLDSDPRLQTCLKTSLHANLFFAQQPMNSTTSPDYGPEWQTGWSVCSAEQVA